MKRGAQFLVAISLLACSASLLPWPTASADELKLKDGSKITGTIVGFEENSFKVKTSYGYAVVQKDQVATISMSDASANPGGEKKSEPATEKPATPPKPSKTETAVAPAPAAPAASASKAPAPAATESSSVASADPAKTPKKETASVSAPTAATPSKPAPAPTTVAASSARAPAAGGAATAPVATSSAPSAGKNAPPAATAKSPAAVTAPAPASTPAPAKPAGPPPVREEVSGNQYVNETYGFRMYKPPGWDLIAGARAIMPGALAALGTSDERTYLMIGLAPAGETLTDSIDQAEQRLREAMASFRVTDQKRLMVSGVSSIAHRFRGSVEQHEWSGIVVFVPLGAHIYTIFGMTYAESDLVQIQENVINRAITSLQFSRN
ncbi:MAG TPA: hypothetical protein VEX69_07410 [Candidatus Limnocylindria bacterium]|nr:hypothetical protein [Candidatus Limnocylindria bacterium]